MADRGARGITYKDVSELVGHDVFRFRARIYGWPRNGSNKLELFEIKTMLTAQPKFAQQGKT
jgi:hypothetical protein